MNWKDITFNIDKMDCTSPDRLNKSWNKHMEKYAPTIKAMCIEDSRQYDFNTEVYPVMKKAYLDDIMIERVRESFNLLSGFIEKRFRERFGELEVTIVLYPGLCNGAGWVTKIEDEYYVLLGIEKIIELNWTSIEKLFDLINHELGHVLMYQARDNLETDPQEEPQKSVFQLYSEGIAEYVSNTLSPNENIRGALWIDWCEENQDLIAKTFLERLEKKHKTQDFFGDWVTLYGKSDLGYYLGHNFIVELTKTLPFNDLLKLPLETIEEHMIKYLKKVA